MRYFILITDLSFVSIVCLYNKQISIIYKFEEMGICGEKVQPPTKQSQRYVLILKLLVLPQLGVCALQFIAHEAFLKQAIFGLFFLLLIFAGVYKLAHQAMMIYVFMSVFFVITFLVYILTIVQNGVDVASLDQDKNFQFIVACVSLGFYFIISIFAFFPYREFKAIQFAQNPALADFMMHNAHLKREQELEAQPKDDTKNNANQKKFKQFKGKGVSLM